MSGVGDNINNSSSTANSNYGINGSGTMPQSPISVASAVSSETTSESHSVSDEQITAPSVNRKVYTYTYNNIYYIKFKMHILSIK